MINSKRITRLFIASKAEQEVERLLKAILPDSPYKGLVKSLGVDIIIVEQTLPKSYEAELVEDIMSLVASSSSKVYGKRSAENRKKKQIESQSLLPVLA